MRVAQARRSRIGRKTGATTGVRRLVRGVVLEPRHSAPMMPRRLDVASRPEGPVAVGYLRLVPDREVPDESHPPTMTELLRWGQDELARFAPTRGWLLGDVFIDDDPTATLGWTSVLVTVRTTRPVAVLVPDVQGVCPPALVLGVLRQQLAAETGTPLLLVHHREATHVEAATASWPDLLGCHDRPPR